MQLKNHSLKSFVILAVSLIYLQPCFSQSEKPQKWEVGADLLSLFDKNQLPDYSIFASRKLGENGYSMRARFGIDAYTYQLGLPVARIINDEQRKDFSFMIGVEKLLSDPKSKTKFYTAIDLAYAPYRTDKQFTGSENSDNYGFYSEINRNRSYYINFSIGIRQSITTKLSLRLESALSYKHKAFDQTTYWIELDPNNILPPKNELMDMAENNNYKGSFKYAENYLRLVPFSQFLITYDL